MSVNRYELIKDEFIIKSARLHWTSLVSHFCLMLVGIGFITIIFALLRMVTTKLIITNKRIIGKSGVIGIYTMDTPLNKINNISISQGLFGRIFDYGLVLIHTSSKSYIFKQISSPNEFKVLLINQISKLNENKVLIA